MQMQQENTPPQSHAGHIQAAHLRRLLAEAPKLENPDGTADTSQALAMECTVVLRGLPQAFSGVLSTTPEGGYRLMTPMGDKHRGVFMEQFFSADDVVSVMVERKLEASGPRIITA